MLQSEKASNILLSKAGNKLNYHPKLKNDYNINQEFYIISDDKIEEGDWYVSIDAFGNILDIIKSTQAGAHLRTQVPFLFKKIIATTDTSLNLPQPSEGFIKKFIESYNDPDKATISDVMVEYEEILCPIDNTGFINIPVQRVKVDSNNCITITKVKDSFTLEEFKQIASDAWLQSIKKTNEPLIEDGFGSWWNKQNF